LDTNLLARAPPTTAGGKRKNWLGRWFVLDITLGTLRYYANASESKVKGEIRIVDMVSVVRAISDSEQRSFSIVTKIGRTYNLMVENPRESRVWVEALNAVVPRDISKPQSEIL
jgi:hypothetical protein